MVLPTNPGQMPFVDINDECHFMREAFYELASMADDVEIVFEKYEDDCSCNDSYGIWHVTAHHGSKRFHAEHENIKNALWFVIQHMAAKDRSEYEAREAKRNAALAKLTDDERRLLGFG